MGAIIDKITEFIKEMLQGWVLDNLSTMFTDVNDKVGTIAGEVGKTPSSWNSGIFSMIQSLSENVMVPIAGMIISAILCYELITMVMDKNNMHEIGSEFFFRYLVKACIAVLFVSYTFDITMAIFDVGNHIVTKAAGVITGNASIDVTATLQTMFNTQLSTMGIGELIGLGIETMIVSLCMKIMSVLITVILYGRMIEIYLYVSVAPVPFATLSNREWGSIGSNYIKGLCALAFQGFFIMVCVGIYSVLVSGVAVAGNLHSALWSVAAYTVILCFSLFKTGSLSKSIFNKLKHRGIAYGKGGAAGRWFPAAMLMAISVAVPKNLSGIKTKVAMNLTKRQLVCFGSAGAVGIPFYIFTKGVIGTQASALIMVALMLPFFFLAMYEKDGFPAEKILYFMLRQKILTPGIRPYKSENLYRQLEEKERMKKEVRYLEEKAAGRNAGQAG